MLLAAMEKTIPDWRDGKMIDVYEIEPAEYAPEIAAKVRPVVRHTKRRSDRYLVPSETTMPVEIGSQKGNLRDFSSGGLAVELSTEIEKGTHHHLWLGAPESYLRQELRERGLNPILCEVRWSRQRNKGDYVNGLEMKFLTASMRADLLQRMRSSILKKVS